MTAAAVEIVPDEHPHWRRNVFALWFSMLVTVSGFTFQAPFLPVFLSHDLGVHDPRQLSLWTGVSAGALGAGLLVASPFWGVLADRFGRKPMLIRALVFGGLTVLLTGFSRNPLDATILRFLFGALGGPVTIAIAMVSLQTPRSHVGWAVGMVSSATSLAGAIGPAAGGVAASVFGLRQVFFLGGGLYLLGMVPVLLVLSEVRERAAPGQKTPSVGGVIRSQPRAVLVAIGFVLLCQLLLNTAASMTQPMVVLRLLASDPARVTVLTGITFSAAGVATALTAATYSGVAVRLGYRPIAIAAAFGQALFVIVVALTSSLLILIGAVVLVAVMNGILTPALTTVLGLGSPAVVRATVMGVSGSMLAGGLLVGPLVAGTVAAAGGPSSALVGAAVVLAGMAIVFALAVREPSAEAAPKPA